MKSYYQGFVVVLLAIVLSGCAGVYAPELAEEESIQSYQNASKAIERAQELQADQQAKEKFEQAKSLFEEARLSLEEAPTKQTAEKFRQVRAKADEAVISAQQTLLKARNSSISEKKSRLDEKSAQIIEHKEKLEEREQTVTALEDELASRKAKDETLQDMVVRLENKTELLADTVAEKESRLVSLHDTLARREAKIDNLSETVSLQKSALESRADTIMLLREKVFSLASKTEEGWDWQKISSETFDAEELEDQASDTAFYRLESQLEFDIGRVTITDSHREELHSVAEVAQAFSNHFLLAVGSTDDIPPTLGDNFNSNWEVGAQRALNSVEDLIQNFDIDAQKVAGLSLGEYGEFRPEYEDLPEAEKRRVEFWLIPYKFFEEMPEI